MSEALGGTITGSLLSGAEREVLRCLFFHGPREDGDIPSKVGRGDLYHRGFVQRGHGWNWLTSAGTDYAIIPLRFDLEKEKWLRDRSAAQDALAEQVVELRQQLRVHE
jgi:hypothetical protein